jgi:hypothetical protein
MLLEKNKYKEPPPKEGKKRGKNEDGKIKNPTVEVDTEKHCESSVRI